MPLRLPGLAIGPAPSEDAPVRSVGTDVGIVKGQILRVERAFGDDGLGMHQRKAQSVRGMENQQPMRLGAADHGLVARLRWAVRMLVAKHRRMTRIRSHAIKRPGCQHNVVRFGTTELHQSQLRLAPAHAVIALRITAKKRMTAGVHLAVLHRDVPGLVIHPVLARGGIQKNTVIAAARALPGRVVRDCNLLGLRMMQLLSRTAAQRFNQIAVHKQLTPRAQFQGRFLSGGIERQGQKTSREQTHAVHTEASPGAFSIPSNLRCVSQTRRPLLR